MTPILVRDACLAAGTIMVAVGAGMQWGAPIGLISGGVALLVLTVYTFRGA
jgi:hypothetical protein